MRGRRVAAPVAAIVSAPAAAAPKFKSVPGSGGSEGGGEEADGGFWADFGADGPYGPYIDAGATFLANNYAYLLAAAVVLILFLFARGSRAGTAGAGPAEETDEFFEPGDADRFGGR